jgi:hypothetical protein
LNTLEQEINKIEAEYQEWCKWEVSNTRDILVNLPLRVSKIQNMWRKLKRKYDVLEKEYDTKYINKFSYYKNEYSVSLSSSEIKTFIDKDTDMIDIIHKKQNILRNIEYMEKMIKNLESMQWTIKTYLEFEKFFNGGI